MKKVYLSLETAKNKPNWQQTYERLMQVLNDAENMFFVHYFPHNKSRIFFKSQQNKSNVSFLIGIDCI